MKDVKKDVQALLSQVISKSWTDESFKSRLVANPVSAFQEIHPDFKMPAGKTLVVTDQTQGLTNEPQDDPNCLYLNIPSEESMREAFDELELTDEQLEAVSGGWAWVPYAVGIALIGDFVDGFIDGWNGAPP